MAGKAFNIRLIPEFHGISSDHMVSEWLELVCEMCGVDNVECILPLRLRGGALSVYRRLTCDQREDLQQVKRTLLVAFAPDPFVTFDTYVSRHLRLGKLWTNIWVTYRTECIWSKKTPLTNGSVTLSCQDSPVQWDNNCVGPQGWSTWP